MGIISPEKEEEIRSRFGRLLLLDDVVRQVARDGEQVPILGDPLRDDSSSDYEYLDGQSLDRMVDEACRAMVAHGL